MKKLVYTCVLALSSCVMPGDLQRLADVQETALTSFQMTEAERQEEIVRILEDSTLSQEAKTEELQALQVETAERLKELAAVAEEDAKAVITEIKDRTESIVTAAKSTPITGNPLLDLLLAGMLGGVSVPATSGIRRRLAVPRNPKSPA